MSREKKKGIYVVKDSELESERSNGQINKYLT
jgi:hypothetical protein